MLCYVMLCYVMLCYVMLCYVMLRYVVLYAVVQRVKFPTRSCGRCTAAGSVCWMVSFRVVLLYSYTCILTLLTGGVGVCVCIFRVC
jgi:hypothetical protein